MTKLDDSHKAGASPGPDAGATAPGAERTPGAPDAGPVPGSIEEFRRYQVRTMPPGVRVKWMSAEIPATGSEALLDTMPPNQVARDEALDELTNFFEEPPAHSDPTNIDDTVPDEEPAIPRAKPYDPAAARLDVTVVSMRRRKERNSTLAKIVIFVLLACSAAVLTVQLSQSGVPAPVEPTAQAEPPPQEPLPLVPPPQPIPTEIASAIAPTPTPSAETPPAGGDTAVPPATAPDQAAVARSASSPERVTSSPAKVPRASKPAAPRPASPPAAKPATERPAPASPVDTKTPFF